jgi:hypothetical protein
MVNRASPQWRDRTAIGLSIAAHLCVLALVATIPRPTFTNDVQDERVLLASIIRIEHRAPPKVAKSHPAAALAAPKARPYDVPVIHAARTVAHAARALVVATEQRFVSRTSQAANKPARTVSALAAVAPDPHPMTVAVTPTPTAMPTPAPAATAVSIAHEDGIGNFGEDYPAKVDPQYRNTLFAGISDTVQIRVTVDESGRAVSIEFVRAPSDPALVQELRARLLAARFIPAVCNGLRCSGTVPLHN